VICFDNDKAGRDGTNTAINNFRKHGVKVKVFEYSAGDPNEMIQAYGERAVHQAFENIQKLTFGA